jgi:hypothetical protein
MRVRAGVLLVAAAIGASACDRPAQKWAPASHGDGGLLEPTGLKRLNQQSWDLLAGNGWSYLRRTSSRDDDIVTDATAPFSPQSVLRIIFTPDMKHDTEPSVHWIGLPNIKEVRTGWWIKLSPNWRSSPAGGGKMTFLHAAPNGQGQVYIALFNAAAPHRVSVNTEWAPYGQMIWEPNITATPIEYDRWYRIDWYLKWESVPGSGDGVVRWWVDDVLNGSYVTVRFPAASLGFHQFEFAPTLQNPPLEEQYMYIGKTDISCAR